MAHGDNPAARISWFLTSLRDGVAPETQLADAVSMLFAMPDNAETLLPWIADVIAQGRLTREAIDALPDDANAVLLLENFGEVEKGLANLHTPWHVPVSSILTPIEKTGWHALKIAVDLLHRYAREPVIAEDAITSLREHTTELIEAVIATDDLDDEAKAWLIGKLREVREALENVDVLGYHGVEHAYDSVLGGAIHSPSIFARISESKVMSGFVVVMGLLATAVTTAEGVKALTAGPPTPEHVQVVIQRITPVPGPVTPANPAASSPTDVEVIVHGHDDDEKGGG